MNTTFERSTVLSTSQTYLTLETEMDCDCVFVWVNENENGI